MSPHKTAAVVAMRPTHIALFLRQQSLFPLRFQGDARQYDAGFDMVACGKRSATAVVYQ
jgi:hypothetical protein